MKEYIRYMLVLLLSVSIWSCNKKYVEPEFTLSPPEYQIDTSTPAGKRVQAFYDRTKTFILYENLEGRAFAWNFNVINIIDPIIVEIKPDEVELVLDFLDENLFTYYDDAYMSALFPYRIPIADSVYVGNTMYNYTESEASILLSKLNRKFAELDKAQQKSYVQDMHNVFLNLAAKNLERKLEESFFDLSDYNFTIASTSPDRPNPKALGFWTLPVRSGQATAPTRINDVIEWLKTIARYTEEEMKQQFYYTVQSPEGPVQVKSTAMEEKYNYLQDVLLNTYKTDLHQLKTFF